MDHCSEVLAVQNAVAFPQHLVALEAQMVVLAHIAHVEYLFVVLLQQPE